MQEMGKVILEIGEVILEIGEVILEMGKIILEMERKQKLWCVVSFKKTHS